MAEPSQKDPLQRLVSGYSDQPRPLGGYLTLMGAFNALFAAFLLLLRQRSQTLPERVGAASHPVRRSDLRNRRGV